MARYVRTVTPTHHAIRKMIKFREAVAADTQQIAALHITNWRETYRGSMLDHYLDYEVEEERLNHWRERMSHPPENMLVYLAEVGGKLVGFVCAFGNQDPDYGTLVENLHTHKSVRGQGVGKRLLKKAAEWSLETYPDGGMYLEVLESNTAAQGFYAALGGKVVDRRPWVPLVGER